MFFDKKFHWYMFTFRDAVGYKSTTMGYVKKDHITLKQIQNASRYANTHNSSTCIVNLSYLGFMSDKEFHNKGQDNGK